MIVKRNFDLTEYNSYRVHSSADTVLFPQCVEDFKTILNEYNIADAYIVGKGCNTIFAKKHYPQSQPIIIIRDNFIGINQVDDGIEVLSGTDLKDLSIYAMEHGMSGLECFYDIPGCVGGAITMNAGSCGISFSDYIRTITYIDGESHLVEKIGKSEMNHGYRSTLFNDNTKKMLILSCTMDLPKGNKEVIKHDMEEIEAKRMAKQPREYPNAGSVFVRPAEKVYVGPMIEKLGLKGYRIGGAEISTKHAGFIVNVGNATGEDIVELITFIKNKVKNEFGIELQTEQRILK